MGNFDYLGFGYYLPVCRGLCSKCGDRFLFPAPGFQLRNFHSEPCTSVCKIQFTGIPILELVVIMFAFLFVDLFDTLGTLIGVSTKADMLDKNGKLPKIKGALMADAVATTAGAVLGTSTVTTFVESASGVAEGGRTGLTSVTTAILFALALFLSPIFLAIPSFATAPALIVVGFYMLSNVGVINFSDPCEGLPAFICIAAMPFFYSISRVFPWSHLLCGNQPGFRKGKEIECGYVCFGSLVHIEIFSALNFQ